MQPEANRDDTLNPAASPVTSGEPELLATAAAIGGRLCRDALWSGERCNWMGDRMENLDGTWQAVFAAAGPDLYAGTAGIGVFLARLWSFTGEPLVRQTAFGALRQAMSRQEDVSGPMALGLYAGVAGLAWAATEMAEIFGDDESRQAAEELASSLAGCAPNAQGIDLIGGSAGAIPALLDLAVRLGRPELLQRAVVCGDHLLEIARNAGEGALSWDTLGGFSLRDLTGFGHGAAGIAWALSELAHASGEARFQEAADRAVRFEQAHFNREVRNWPDFRDHSSAAGGQGAAARASAAGQPVYALAWCHGAPGIGLGRLRGWQLTGDPALLEQGRVALEATAGSLTQPAQGNFSLCHGHGGNAGLAIFAAQVLGEAEPLEMARRVGRAGIELYHRTRSPWPCGVPEGGETPALMTGLAGIGYLYLRLFAPDRVPPVEIVIPRAPQA